jgi:UDPglucose--hexose-1-phosphate uridylyltransferase
MPELRQNRITKEWVIVATERAKRPRDLALARPVKTPPAYVPNCPFCPGNEANTPPEILRVSGQKEGEWLVRVVPNKFAALSPGASPQRTVHGSKRTITGFGFHEVIVESPDHSMTTALMSDAQVGSMLKVFKARYEQLSLDSRVANITIFKNHGVEAGTSLEHSHCQLIATPVISSQVRSRLHEALRHYDEFGECIFCTVLQDELEEKTRVVMETDHFAVIEPFASATPFNTYIYPKRHSASFGDISAPEITDLARVLRTVLAKLYHGLQDPDYNYTIRSAPAEYDGVKYYHWYVSVIPRLSRVAGFELGSGMFINTVLPEAAAQFLRETEVEVRSSAASSGV